MPDLPKIFNNGSRLPVESVNPGINGSILTSGSISIWVKAFMFFNLVPGVAACGSICFWSCLFQVVIPICALTLLLCDLNKAINLSGLRPLVRNLTPLPFCSKRVIKLNVVSKTCFTGWNASQDGLKYTKPGVFLLRLNSFSSFSARLVYNTIVPSPG